MNVKYAKHSLGKSNWAVELKSLDIEWLNVLRFYRCVCVCVCVCVCEKEKERERERERERENKGGI